MTESERDTLVAALTGAGFDDVEVLHRHLMMAVDGAPEGMGMEYKVRIVMPREDWNDESRAAAEGIYRELGVHSRVTELTVAGTTSTMVVWR